MSAKTDRLVHDYLEALESAAAELPPHTRHDLAADIREHLDNALGPPPYDEIAVRTELARLGEPGEIVAAAGERTQAPTEPGERREPRLPVSGPLPLGLDGQRCSAGGSVAPDGTGVTTPEVCEGFALPQVVGVPLLVVLVAAPVAVVLLLASRAAPGRG